MDRLTYELQFITPCFNGGHSQKKSEQRSDHLDRKDIKENKEYIEIESELRPASFIGLLRFWGRVVLSSFFDGKNLYKKESILFGNEKEAGKFYIRIEKTGKIEYKKLYNENSNNKKNNKNSDNENYLSFGMKGKLCIREGYKFKIHIITKSEYTEIIKNICRLAFTWGSLGYKSRKGLGSLKIVKEIINGKESTLKTDDIKLLSIKFWQDILEKHKIINKDINEIKNNETPSLKNLKLFKIKSNEKDKLKFLWKVYETLRKENNKTPEYKYIINKFLNGEEITDDKSKIRNIPFGLPIQYTSKSRGKKIGEEEIKPKIILYWEYKNQKDNSLNSRRASMVLFKIKDDAIYALFFKSKLLPDDTRLAVRIINKKDEIKILNLKNKYLSFDIDQNLKNSIIENSIKALKEKGFEEVEIK